ncbi:VWA domain-containing protein [Spirochaetota bacterium]
MLFFASICASVQAQSPELVLSPADLRIEQLGDGGYHLYIKAKAGLGSVLLAETTKDPFGKEANYAYRAESWNPINGDEKRMLDGVFLDSKSQLFSLIDSSPEPDPLLGMAFHIFIPWVVTYGYPWTRNGREFLSDGSFINIRTFSEPYADYRGAFADNPYKISVTQRPLPRPEPISHPAVEAPAAIVQAPEAPPEKKEVAPKPKLELYMPETLKSFEAIAKAGKGELAFSEGEADIVPVLARILDKIEGDSLDLVICLDTTESMADDIDAVKLSLPEMVKEKTARFSDFRLGLVLYKDYFEDYVVKRMEFTKDVALFTRMVTSVKVGGGRDIPEAVYEALYEALGSYEWTADAKHIVLIGDAPAHPIPRGKIDKAMVDKMAAQLGVVIDAIILPH